MRIVGGRWAGRDLVSPGGRVRPTREEIRADLFDRLESDINRARVLDLFAGTGALGLEALSRGATSVDFVENGASALHALKANIARLRAKKWTRLFKKDAFTFLEGVPRAATADPGTSDGPRAEGETERPDLNHLPYDLVLADPPYTSRAPERLAALWLEAPFSRILCIEHASERPLPRPGKRRVFGDTMVTTFRLEDRRPRRARAKRPKSRRRPDSN
jgi:16S rRNA (guanine966-N2)-methyltransferase